MPAINNSDSRMMRGMEIAEKGKISENEDGSFSVPSQTDKTLIYEIRLIESSWVCTCPDFENRAGEIDACKHIHAVKFWIAQNTYIENKPKPKVFAEDAVLCERCGSVRVMKYGKYGEKQMYLCKDCGHKFREMTLLKKIKYTPELITITLDLYFKGISLRKISDHLSQMYGEEISYTTIYSWINKYIPTIAEYVNSLTPQLSETWHADELFVKMKNGDKIKHNKTIAYVWNVMDRKTRFLLASKLSERRDMDGALNGLCEAVKNAHGQKPQLLYTDALRSYGEAIPYAFGSRSGYDHIAKCGIAKPHANNNRIERMNGTLRERVKVQRGWKSMKTPLAEGARINYNFIKPHMALDGQTPAEKAGLSKETWMSLLKKSLNATRQSS